MEKEHELYSLLQVNKNADLEEIKRQYWFLAGQFHPDKVGQNQKFLEITEAYTILKDPLTRQKYDLEGLQGFGRDNLNIEKEQRRVPNIQSSFKCSTTYDFTQNICLPDGEAKRKDTNVSTSTDENIQEYRRRRQMSAQCCSSFFWSCTTTKVFVVMLSLIISSMVVLLIFSLFGSNFHVPLQPPSSQHGNGILPNISLPSTEEEFLAFIHNNSSL